MPKTLSASPGSFPAQTAPLPGEPRTAGSVEAGFQNAADRSQYLYDRLMYLDPTRGGVRRLRSFATEAALKASTDYQDGTIAVVGQRAIYRYDASSTAAPASPWTLKPDDGGAAGRWRVLAVGGDLFGATNGIPILNANGRIPTELLEASNGTSRIAQASLAWGRVLDVIVDGSAINESIAPNSAFAVPDLIVTAPSVQVGDRLIFSATIETYTALTDSVSARVRRTNPDTSYTYGPRDQVQPTDAREQRTAHALIMSTIAGASGQYDFAVEIETHNANASNVAASLGYAHLQVIRP